MADFICAECEHEWSLEPDEDGLFNGYVNPPCPECINGRGVSPSNYGDFKCNVCGYEFRKYGNGGLRLGMIPKCEECGGSCRQI